PAAPNLHVAFETATRAIAARERELGHEPSLPQAYFGEQVHRKLAELEAARCAEAGRETRARPAAATAGVAESCPG
ncbi:MAG TPA: hypothetical protein VFP37_18260, partial [Steroidobacteraceae bacterium]|nr:hypothetical protein [Steroidobacteraceae bacterium]